MPRPKVKPQDRRRSARACSSCKHAKIRCDSTLPCQPCVKRGRSNRCVYTATSSGARRSTDGESSAVADVLSSEAHLPRQDGVQLEGVYVGSSSRDGRVEALNQQPSPDTTERENSPSDIQTESRMVMSSSGERMYVGAISSLSLLEFLRQVLRRHMGPSSFTETESDDMTLEIDQHHRSSSLPELIDLDVDAPTKHLLVCSYFEVTSAILHTYTRDEVAQFSSEKSVHDAGTDLVGVQKKRHNDLVAMYLVLAIGGQCHTSYQEVSAVYFRKGQQIAFESLLCDPSVDMIRHFVLMSFYMLGACRRNTAYMYLGVAWRAACTLGLHRADQCNNCTREEIGIRLRTWRSLRILDTLVNSILGRSTSTSHVRPDIDKLYDLLQSTNRNPGLDATHRICLLIDKVSTNCGKLDFRTAEQLLRELRDWTQQLPDELRIFNPVAATSTGNLHSKSECLGGATHVACSYYFAIILITRQFFISHLVNNLRLKDQVRLDQIADSAQHAKLAQTCLQSAVHMAGLCIEAIKSTLLHENMTILIAWTFVAGLLLGFSLFAESRSDSRTNVATAFTHCCTALEYFAKLNQQAGHYYDILINFHEIIEKRHEQLAAEKHSFTNHYVAQILRIATPQNTEQEDDSIDETESEVLHPQIDLASAYNDIDILSTEVWDEFLLDNQPLTVFF